MPDAASGAAASTTTASTDADRLLPCSIRLAAGLLILLLTAGLFMVGSQPVAAGLFKPGWDKLAHVVMFAGLGAAYGVASGRRGWRLLLWSVLGALAVGSMDELHQLKLPGREPGWDDLLADGVGGLLGGVSSNVAYVKYAKWKLRIRARSSSSLQASGTGSAANGGAVA